MANLKKLAISRWAIRDVAPWTFGEKTLSSTIWTSLLGVGGGNRKVSEVRLCKWYYSRSLLNHTIYCVSFPLQVTDFTFGVVSTFHRLQHKWSKLLPITVFPLFSPHPPWRLLGTINYCAIIPTRLICPMWPNCPGAEFVATEVKSR